MQQAKIILLMSAGLMLESAAAAIDPKVVIPARQAGMKQIGQNFKTINDQLRSGSADIAVVRARARQLAVLAARTPSWFPSGTGPDAGVKTAAKAEIWTRSAEFGAKAVAFTAATRALATAASKSRDASSLAPQIRAVGGACKACHTGYKVES